MILTLPVSTGISGETAVRERVVPIPIGCLDVGEIGGAALLPGLYSGDLRNGRPFARAWLRRGNVYSLLRDPGGFWLVHASGDQLDLFREPWRLVKARGAPAEELPLYQGAHRLHRAAEYRMTRVQHLGPPAWWLWRLTHLSLSASGSLL